MDNFVLVSGILLILMMGIVMFRLALGPTVIDRLVAVNMLGTKTTVLLVIMGLVFHRVEMFVDISLGYALLNFIASVGAAKYFQNNQKISPEEEWEVNQK